MRSIVAAVLLGLSLSGEAAAAPGASSDAVSPGWWDQVRSRVEETEYEVSWQTETALANLDEAWQAPNRAHGFRSYFTQAGIRLIDRTEVEATWESSLRLVRYGRGEAGTEVLPASIAVAGNRVNYARDGIVEWYVNDPRGLEQGFELTAPPEVEREDGSVFLEIELGGTLRPVLGSDGRTIDFQTVAGRSLMRYAELHVLDATGRELPAWMELFSAPDGRSGLRLRFDDTQGVWPITVDPLLSAPLWIVESNHAMSSFGATVGTAGDVNGDGYSDVLIGAPVYDNGQASEGRVFVYYGSPSGPSLVPDWTAETDFPGGWFGYSAGPAGDVNGDGFGDLIVGAPRHYGSQFLEGRAWVYHGSPTGLAGIAWSVDSDQNEAQFGYSVSSAGDLNNDGYADVIVGAPFYDSEQANEGGVFAFFGSDSGLGTEPAWIGESNQADSRYGWSVAPAGDVNGDEYHDIIVGAPFYTQTNSSQGFVFVYHGGPAGPGPVPNFSAGPAAMTNAWFGWSVATAGDVNGDNLSDVIVGARQFTSGQANEGAAYVYYGSTSGLSSPASWQSQSNVVGANLGWSVSTAGDVNGDGYADVVVGAPRLDNGDPEEGRAYMYLGSPTGLPTSPSWVNEPNIPFAEYGKAVATAGDVDGDGYSDVIIGGPRVSNGETEEGRVWLYRGTAGGTEAAAGWHVDGDPAGSELGFSVAAAGDVDGDRYSDLIVGAPNWDNGFVDEGVAFLFRGTDVGPETVASWLVEGGQAGAHFGWSVASAGDTNGDGYDDLIVGAPDYTNGQFGEGRVTAYLGTENGPANFPAWSAEGNQAAARFGFVVAPVGDIDGDGRMDVAVGAPQFDNGQNDEGAAFVYHGGEFGPVASPSWMQDGDQAGAAFGYDVASAGDIQGDGHSDLIVGAPLFNGSSVDDGRAYVYRGTAFSLITQPFWTGVPTAQGGRYGWSVDGAGDVNGDGYADVVVGSPFYSNGQANEGAAFLYQSTGTSLFDTAAWSVQSDQAQAWLGYSVAGAGDLNGDGYADVVVGAPQFTNGQSGEGRATAYLGSGVGLSTVPTWTAEADQAAADFGLEVAAAGDVNADGYGDIVVGAPRRDATSSDEGRTTLYYGNGRGRDVTPQQRRYVNDAPIASLGLSDSETILRLQARGRTAFGGGEVRLEWEVRPQGTPLSGTPTGSTTTWLPGGSTVVSFTPLAGDLTPGGRYHWQVRTLYRPSRTPWQPHSRWFRQPVDGKEELDVRMPVTSDLFVLQTDSKDPVFIGEAYTYTVTVQSSAFDTVEVSVQDALPPATSFVSLTPSQGECIEADKVVTCMFGEVAPAGTASVDITVLPLTAGVQSNLAAAESPASEMYPPNNQVTITTTVNTPAIGNRVWSDLDGNGSQDIGEPGVGNVLVALYNGSGVLEDVAVTALDGTYTLPALVYDNDYFVRFFPPPGFVFTMSDQGDDLSDSDADPFSLATPVFSLVEQDDLVRWDAGLIPFCLPPDEAIFIASMDLTDDGNDFAILNFQDPNQPSQVTGYNVYRSSDPELPSASWPLVASDVVDMDLGTPNKQWVDSTGDEPPAGIWYYKVTAYNDRCPAEGPFQGE